VKEKDRTAQTLVNMLMYADDMVVMDSDLRMLGDLCLSLMSNYVE